MELMGYLFFLYLFSYGNPYQAYVHAYLIP